VKRLVGGELQIVWAHLNVTVDKRATPNVPLTHFEGRFLPDELWLSNRTPLATALDDDEYMELAGLYAGLDLYRRVLADLGPSAALRQTLVDQASHLREHVETAYHVLTGRTLEDEPVSDEPASTA
jgi:hypothetical protein